MQFTLWLKAGITLCISKDEIGRGTYIALDAKRIMLFQLNSWEEAVVKTYNAYLRTFKDKIEIN
jgi:hypothetical protein